MAYCTVAEVKNLMGMPGGGASSASNLRDTSGTAVDDDRWSDAFIETIIDAGAAAIDGTIGRRTSIPAASDYAKQLNILWSVATLLEGDAPVHIAEGGRTRAEATWKQYNTLMDIALRNPQVLGGAAKSFYYTHDGD
jgi:hypothetical protein